VVGLTRAAALETAGRGVRINALVTGTVDTPLFRWLLGAPPEGELEAPDLNPAGRVAKPEEVAAFVTGAALAVDGGSTAQ
jgi:NAD(P)-dependent dehydrogenase (short-subunit alcohol dehydrogenase family)